MKRDEFEKLIEKYPELTTWGYGVNVQYAEGQSRSEYHAQEHEGLKTQLENFELCLEWLDKNPRLEGRRNAHYWKDRVQSEMRPENAFINVKNTSLTITADVTVPANADGVVICQGGDFGGWTFYILDGKLGYTYNWVGLESYTITSNQKVPPGTHTLAFDFANDGGRGSGGTGTLSLNGQKVGEGRINRTNSNTFGIDESADVGLDENTPVYPAYAKRDRFTGKIASVTIETHPAK